MAEEVYIVAIDIQSAGSGFVPAKFESKAYGAAKETSIGSGNFEAGGLYSENGIRSNVATCKLVELKSGSAAEAVEVARQLYGTDTGPGRAVVKPNTNFKAVA